MNHTFPTINRSLSRWLILLVCLFIIPGIAAAQATEKATENVSALLWKIEHPDMEQASYLFGTMHIIPAEHYFLPDSLETFLQRSDVLALEINMDNPMMLMSAITGVWMKDGVTLEDLLEPDDYEEVIAAIQKKSGLPGAMVKRMKPMLISALMMDAGSDEDGNQGTKSYEMELMTMSRNLGMKIEGLETVQYQLEIFDKIPYELQAQALLESVRDISGEQESLGMLIDLYTSQDIDGMANVMEDEFGPMTEYLDLFLKDRNINWISKIVKLIHESPVFIAVGAGHLGGEYGVVSLLRQEGYVLTPVP